MSDIQKYEPMLEVITKDGSIYYIEAAKKEEFKRALNTDSFVELNGEMLSRFEIIKVRNARTKPALANFPPEIRREVNERAETWKSNLNKSAPEAKLLEWAEKLQRGERIN